ncbi:thiamin pyrophosphokinase 1-like [Strongylocentrotus purpuratus]|uniref:Thiamine pyrophosphokinase 1 n=1 Tax=Strongylocentrotus purpuratus TaxID=7668 RepID=A0A7M7ST32_STRPU|nr:thiamin pyrophosphokinase 1-like [Strongylocentrotus purpuratus]
MLHIGWLLGRCVSYADSTSTRMAAEKLWSPLSCFQPGLQKDANVALIILNRPIHDVQPLLKRIWDGAVIRAAADGGANRLQECMSQEDHRYVPDIVSGDFDSVREEVVQYCKERGSDVIHTPDQNSTDFTKCLKIVVNIVKKKSLAVDSIVVFGAFGGRIDQTIANINTLFLASAVTDLPVYLLGDDSLACLLLPGRHRIKVDTGLEAEWCGLIPIGTECKRASTTGLKWNLENQSMQFGGLVSTSNSYAPDAQEVSVSTEQPLLWTMGIQTLTSEGHNGSLNYNGSSEQSKQETPESHS